MLRVRESMELVLSGLAALGLGVVVLFVVSLRSSLARDKIAAEKARAEAKEARMNAARKAALARKGTWLRCLGCEARFRGPLKPTGCPDCGLESLVITEAEYRERKEE
jgi:heme exporter protein D